MKSTKRIRSLSLVGDTRGLSTVEYAMLFVLIVVGAISFWQSIGQTIVDELSAGSSQFDSGVTPPSP